MVEEKYIFKWRIKAKSPQSCLLEAMYKSLCLNECHYLFKFDP